VTETEQVIAGILRENHGIRATQIQSDTAINKDLGIDGDDAVELLQAIKTEFQIDIRDFQFDEFFGPESVGLLNLFGRVIRGDIPKLRRLSLSELAHYVDTTKSRAS
jgi:acyl carrier protein